jgi:D-Tyr-tRNAtyr deacylase
MGYTLCVGLEEGENDHTSSSLYNKVYRIRVLKYQHRKIDIKI